MSNLPIQSSDPTKKISANTLDREEVQILLNDVENRLNRIATKLFSETSVLPDQIEQCQREFTQILPNLELLETLIDEESDLSQLLQLLKISQLAATIHGNTEIDEAALLVQIVDSMIESLVEGTLQDPNLLQILAEVLNFLEEQGIDITQYEERIAASPLLKALDLALPPSQDIDDESPAELLDMDRDPTAIAPYMEPNATKKAAQKVSAGETTGPQGAIQPISKITISHTYILLFSVLMMLAFTATQFPAI